MATFFQSVRQGFGRANTKSQQNLRAAAMNNGNSPTLNTNQPPVPPIANSPSVASNYSTESGYVPDHDSPKKFMNEKYAKCSVKGNFLTLAAQPKNVELGEWLAHQLVEMNRLLTGMIQVIQEVDQNTGLPSCNDHTCPTMSAGRLTYTWLENGRPAKIPAPSYIVRVQRWIVGKIHDPSVFPTDPPTGFVSTTGTTIDNNTPTNHQILNSTSSSGTSQQQIQQQQLPTDWIGKPSGFPLNFHNDVKSIVKQMFRCYAHLYHNHWDHPFWHINRHLELNSCFVHFITVAMYYDLLPKKDMEPLQGLVDIFVAQGVVPKEAVQQHAS